MDIFDIAEYEQRIADEKQQEIRRATRALGGKDLLTWLLPEPNAFDFECYDEHERTLLLPALHSRGFSDVSFFMGERDSFGPLSRGVRALRDNKRFTFYYG